MKIMLRIWNVQRELYFFVMRLRSAMKRSAWEPVTEF